MIQSTHATFNDFPRAPLVRGRLPLLSFLTAIALAALLFAAMAPFADAALAGDDQKNSSSPAKQVLVKAEGQGVAPLEAEQGALPGKADMPKRSMRQKSSQPPVNMTGAAGRESGLPVPSDVNRKLPSAP
jgi:hypothetical protein